jgi:glycosyl transferase family 1
MPIVSLRAVIIGTRLRKTHFFCGGLSENISAMRILYIADHAAVCVGHYMFDAFRRIGVDIRSIGPVGAPMWGLNLPELRPWKPQGSLQTIWSDWKPDLVIWGREPVDETVRRYADTPQVLQTVDNHVLSWKHERIEHYFLAHLHGQEMRCEGPNVTWLPCAYDPVFFTPSPIPWSERKFDATLLGVMYPQRIELVEGLRAAGINVFTGLGAVYEEYRDIYHQTRISLCCSAARDVGQRVFETAAMRCLILTDPCPDLPHLKADGIVLFNDIATAVKSVRQILANPRIAESAIDRSYAWVKPHTWDARAREIVNWYENRRK